MNESVWAQVSHELHGGNGHQIEIRRRTLADGNVALWEQCVICGAAVRAVSARDNRVLRMASIAAFDDRLRDKFLDTQTQEAGRRLQAEHQETADRINQDWWDAYNQYLKTPQWMAKSQHVLERDNYLCQACLRRPATEAHHMHYKHVFEEPLFGLIAVCKPCHDKITAIDRKRRQGWIYDR